MVFVKFLPLYYFRPVTIASFLTIAKKLLGPAGWGCGLLKALIQDIRDEYVGIVTVTVSVTVSVSYYLCLYL